MFLCPLANIVGIFRHGNTFQNQRPKTFVLSLRTRQGQGPGLTSLCILPLHSPHCSLPRVRPTSSPRCSVFVFCQLRTNLLHLSYNFFSPDVVTFAILLKEVGFMGRATSRDKSPVCLLRSGRARVVEFDMDQTCRRPGRSICLVGSGLVGSGPVWSVSV